MKRLNLFILATILITLVSFGLAEDGPKEGSTYWGDYSANEYAPNSTSNDHGTYGNRYGFGVNNKYSKIGQEANDKYGYDGPKIYSDTGEYLGRLNKNKYDPDSVSNPYGTYGSKYNPTGVNNPWSPNYVGDTYNPTPPSLWEED